MTGRTSLFTGISVAALTAVASAQAVNVWTQVANTGIVDSADTAVYQSHNTGSVSIKSEVAAATIDIRYSIAANGSYGYQGRAIDDPENWEGPTPCVRLQASLRDTGPGARVVVRLRRLDLSSGALRTLGLIDSDAHNIASTSYTLFSECMDIPVDYPFDFRFFGYFIEAQLIKTSPGANPGLRMVQLCGALACEEF